jgi:hypothetical protein
MTWATAIPSACSDRPERGASWYGLRSDQLGVEQGPCDKPAEHEPTDVREERHAVSFRRRGEERIVGFEELVEEPAAQVEPGGITMNTSTSVLMRAWGTARERPSTANAPLAPSIGTRASASERSQVIAVCTPSRRTAGDMKAGSEAAKASRRSSRRWRGKHVAER